MSDEEYQLGQAGTIDIVPAVPPAEATAPAIDYLAREVPPDEFVRILNLARSRAKATLDACKGDFLKGRKSEKTYERNKTEWGATIAYLDDLKHLAII